MYKRQWQHGPGAVGLFDHPEVDLSTDDELLDEHRCVAMESRFHCRPEVTRALDKGDPMTGPGPQWLDDAGSGPRDRPVVCQQAPPGGGHAHRPVSYTHLDVYKRQFPYYGPFGDIKDVVACEDQFRNCLLYTSRCV